MILRTLAMACFLCLGACSERAFEPQAPELSDVASVRIMIAAGTYAPGSRVELAVQNQSVVEYVWNPCLRTLQLHSTLGWVSVDEGERVCTLEGWLLRPDQRISATTDLAARLPSGEYRFRYGFGRTSGDYTVSDYQVSNPFGVMPDAR